MFSKVLVAAVVMASVSAHAVESEFFFQSKGGQSDLTLKLGLLSSASKPKGGGTETKVTGLLSGVAYEYGINEQFAVEGHLTYASAESDATPRNKVIGLQDPTVVLKGTSAMGAANLRYGLEVGLGLEKRKYKTNEVNAATGGFSFAPYIGADTETAVGTFGGRFIYAILLERTEELSSGAERKTKDGNYMSLSAFYETKITDATLGASLNYFDYAAEKDVSSGATSRDSHNTLAVSVYSVLPFGAWSMIPRLDYMLKDSGFDSYNAALVSVAGRFTF